MTSLSSSSSQLTGSSSSCRTLPGEGTQVHPRGPLLQILRVAGAREEVFTLKEVMHYLGQYIMMKELYDKQRQHIVHCQDDPLGELLEVGSFSVKNPSPVYEMLKRNLFILNNSDAAKNLSVGKDSNESPSEDPGQVSSGLISPGQALIAGSSSTGATQSCSQRRPRDPDEDSSDGLPRSACKRPKLDVTLEEWDLSGLPWWFLGNLRSNYTRRSNGSTDIHTNQLSPGQDEDTAIVSDTTDDLWFLNEAESEQVSVDMKEAVLEQGSDAESPHEEEETGKDSKDDRKMQEDRDDDSQCLSDDTDTEISTQDAWQCSECRKFNTPLQRYCMRCWALRKDWYKDCPRLVHSISVPDIPACSSRPERDEDEEDDDGIDMPDCLRTVSDPVVLPSHHIARNIPPSSTSSSKGKGPSQLHHHLQESSEGDSQDTLDMETECQPEAILEPCKLCRVRPRNGNIIHGRTAHLITCFPCARRLHRFHAPCPGCGQVIQKVIKTFIA
ncbi:protein Mdm4-like isoform X1 [Sinocyclocheilus rhinocerous]|uniref:Protein Mdm4 n=1 Tax=Sinocyclocheilus rhinocerous TaxID=307959 RepID=A0A673GYK9_9TELE|nr:PREDICTED: protein Mdm4-like isoform X1 [Sinocyclocheilus rhinocerous]